MKLRNIACYVPVSLALALAIAYLLVPGADDKISAVLAIAGSAIGNTTVVVGGTLLKILGWPHSLLVSATATDPKGKLIIVSLLWAGALLTAICMRWSRLTVAARDIFSAPVPEETRSVVPLTPDDPPENAEELLCIIDQHRSYASAARSAELEGESVTERWAEVTRRADGLADGWAGKILAAAILLWAIVAYGSLFNLISITKSGADILGPLYFLLSTAVATGITVSILALSAVDDYFFTRAQK